MLIDILFLIKKMDCKKCYNNDDILSTKLYSCFSNSIFMIPNDLYDYQKENSNILKINQCKSININFKFTDVLKRNWKDNLKHFKNLNYGKFLN